MNSFASSGISRRQFVGQLSLAGAAAVLLPHHLRGAESPADRKLGIAVLGLGSYATHQVAPALQETRYCKLVGVITGTSKKAEQWRKKYDLPKGNIYSYETLDQIANNPAIDIVYVVTPPGTHRDFVVRVAKAGKHVISEKPMAPTVKECDEMIAACKAAGKKLSLGYRLQFDPHHIAMEKYVRDPAHAPVKAMNGGFAFQMGGRAWRVEKKLAGGGPLPDVGIYVIQSACRVAGAAPIAVTAKEDPKTNPELFNEVEETIRWKMEFPSGVVGDGYASYAGNANEFKVDLAHGHFEIGPAFGYSGLEARDDRGRLDIKPINQQAAQMDDFARCVLEDRESPVGGAMGRRDIAIIEAIYASAANGGKRVEVKV
jgi:glucose-fructose oxidoreductase